MHAQSTEGLCQERPRLNDWSPGREREYGTGAGHARRAQQEAHLSAETTGRDQSEAIDPLGVLVGELESDTAPERVPDERCSAVSKRVEQVPDYVRVGADGVIAAELVRVAVAQQIRRQDGEAP